MSDPLALTIPEAAKQLSVSVSTIRAMIADGRLKCARIIGRKGTRGRVVIRTPDLDALLTRAYLVEQGLTEPEGEAEKRLAS